MPAALRAVIFFVAPVDFCTAAVRCVVLLTRWVERPDPSAAGAAIRPVLRPDASARSVFGAGTAATRPVLPVFAAGAAIRPVLPDRAGAAVAGGATLTATRAVFLPSEIENVNRSLPSWIRSRSESRCSLTFLPFTNVPTSPDMSRRTKPFSILRIWQWRETRPMSATRMLQFSPLPTMTAALSRRYATSLPSRFVFRSPMLAALRCVPDRSLADDVDAVLRRLPVQGLPVDAQH